MDGKSSFESYEFLPDNNTESEANQLFVVQNDGTFIFNRQIQYVEQVAQDVREVQDDVQSCTVYDLSSQQFFVDVDDSPELISVSDQFVIPNGENNLYTNSYLLQPSSSTTSEQMDDDNQYNTPNVLEVDVNFGADDSKQLNNFTEITLSDDQYQILEQRGWILLESNDKIFLLNTLGLHDITTNEKLIQKLKNKIQNETDIQADNGSIKMESIAYPSNTTTHALPNQQDMVEIVIKHNDVIMNDDKMDPITFYVSGKGDVQQPLSYSEKESNVPLEIVNISKNETIQINTVLQKQGNNSIKIKTNHTFKEIPDRIFLGKSANGKKIFAKVVKSTKTNTKLEEEKKESIKLCENIGENQEFVTAGLKESEFISLLRDAIMSNSQMNSVSSEDIAAADTIIDQLLILQNFRKPVIERYLIFTRVKTTVTNDEDKRKIYSNGKPTLMMGRVDLADDTHGLFHHYPNMVQEIIASLENKGEKPRKHNINILHIHVSETMGPDNIMRASVLLNKRKLALNLIFETKHNLKTVYACSTCAAVFKSEIALKEHQENHFMDAEDNLTIDTDQKNKVKINNTCSKINHLMDAENDLPINTDQINKAKINAYLKIKMGNVTFYSCTQCETKFSKLGNCINHLKTHSNSIITQTDEDDKISDQQQNTEKTNIEVYRCKMCPSTYFHPSSLSKHIVRAHIQIKLN